jgi:hypothetical protein
MQPEQVKPAKFHSHTIIYNNGDFSIAYGIWDGIDKRLALRWNGDEEGIGYPNQGGNPLWFQLPSDEIWTAEMLKAIKSIQDHETTIRHLNGQLK